MDMEIKAIERNNTWELIDLPQGAKIIGLKWVYKTKLKENGEVDKFKARLVAKGYVQQQEIDYTKVFAPVARMDTVRMIVDLAAQLKRVDSLPTCCEICVSTSRTQRRSVRRATKGL